MSDSGSSSITSGPDNGMLPRRVSNNRADLSGDQQMNYLLSWFANWSELQKTDFVPVLASRMKAGKAGAAVNGDLADGIKAMDTNSDRPPSLFSCQVRARALQDYCHLFALYDLLLSCENIKKMINSRNPFR